MDSRPRAYESPALPLSYLGGGNYSPACVAWRHGDNSGGGAPQILLWEELFVNTRNRMASKQVLLFLYDIIGSGGAPIYEDPGPEQ